MLAGMCRPLPGNSRPLTPGQRYTLAMRPADTSPQAWEVLMSLMRRMSPEEKLQRAIELTAAARNLGEAGICQAYPGASKREIFLRVAQRQLGDEFQKVFGEEWRAYGSAERHA